MPPLRKICCLMILALVPSCGDGGGDEIPSGSDSPVNQGIYDRLSSTDAVNAPEAQPAFPASGELFSENTRHFRTVSAARSASDKNASPGGIAFYTSVSGTLVKSSTTEGGVQSDGIPSFKKPDRVIRACEGRQGEDLARCLDEADSADRDLAPTSGHSSYHDADSLAAMGAANEAARAGRTVSDSLVASTSAEQRAAIAGKLAEHLSDNPSHAGLDLLQHGVFDPDGYRVSHIVITDNSRGDTNGDGALDDHSTAIIEVVKPVHYRRSPNSELDGCIDKYGDGAVGENYLLRVSALVHLDHLAGQRTVPTSNISSPATWEESVAHANELWADDLLNHAFDVNVIKWLLREGVLLPADSTEYTISFQAAPETISGVYSDLITQSRAASDDVCAEILESHIDAYTAIVSGPATDVLYQAPLKQGQYKAFSDAHPAGSYRNYCTLNSTGDVVALYDPAIGAFRVACETKRSLVSRTKITKPGACKGDSHHWAYYPARVRTGRFGRGIQWILTEWLIHDQVGDYKNIHWYQSVWKAGVQTAVKAGSFIARTAIGIYVGSIAVPSAPGGTTAVYIINTVLPYWASVLQQLDGLKIAGYTLTGTAAVNGMLLSAGTADASNATLSATLKGAAGDFVVNWLIGRTTDAVGEMIDVSAVGWQDFDDSSHYGCFEFSY